MVAFDAALPRGTCPIQQFGVLADTGRPLVILFMDAFGPRPALYATAERLAVTGYRVLLPDLFYEHLPFAPLAPQSVFSGGDDLGRLMLMFGAINQSMIDADVRALLSFADEHLGTEAPIAAVGYCMGGRYALTAATASRRVVLAASMHGSNLAPQNDDGPHTRLGGLTARVYIGLAAVDPTFDGTEEGRLTSALRDGGVDHIVETYAGTAHGFVMQDLPVHDPVASERHWQRLLSHLRETFSGYAG